MVTIKEMDLRLRAIPRYQGLVIMKNGLENISRFTANDYCNIMKVIIFVIDNLFIEYKDGEVPCERLCEIFHKYMEMYMKTRQESFTDDDLTNLEVGLYLFLDYAFFKGSINLIDKLLWTIQK